ncbi:MAG: Glycosyl transferase, WecB/TagA/CpsF family [Parcubacteria group bacterium GW2011_GWC1_45_14]|nr:MAG: Glycosyl transferase, WecB/TagA/CpsF family [Parcubacteria group bacterium GW2011_GWC1_45_14]
MEILGVRIDNLSKKEILERIGFFLNEERFHQIATVNPEFILRAQKDREFRDILNNSDLNVADGVGLKYAFIRYRSWLKTRFAGADLMHEILKMTEGRGLGVFLAINKDGLSSFDEIKAALLKIYPKLDIHGEDMDLQSKTYNLNSITCSLLLCNFGAPLQERFINSQKNGTIRLAMGVGGSFDFLTSKAKRAPIWMRKIGLEWLWRGVVQPQDRLKRLKRIFKAVIVFPIKIIFSK